jgi:hypothetical protein
MSGNVTPARRRRDQDSDEEEEEEDVSVGGESTQQGHKRARISNGRGHEEAESGSEV